MRHSVPSPPELVSPYSINLTGAHRQDYEEAAGTCVVPCRMEATTSDVAVEGAATTLSS